MDAAIWWFSGVTSIPRTSSVVPIIHTNSRVTIAAQCFDGSTITGQSEISHPIATATPAVTMDDDNSAASTASSPSPSPPPADSKVAASTANSTTVDKHNTSALTSPIKKIMYVNDDGQETYPLANTTALHRLKRVCIYDDLHIILVSLHLYYAERYTL
jgi:hypothetical protein